MNGYQNNIICNNLQAIEAYRRKSLRVLTVETAGESGNEINETGETTEGRRQEGKNLTPSSLLDFLPSGFFSVNSNAAPPDSRRRPPS
jgi:hypothetical protein